MLLRSYLLLACIFCAAVISLAQKTYPGTLVTKLGQELEGEITVNLEGANGDLIKITTIVKSSNKGKKETITTFASYNTAIIKHIIVDNITFYFRTINTAYEKSLKNVCVRLIYGTVNCGLFQSGDGTGQHSIAVKFPKSSFNELNSSEYYDESSFTVAIQLSECKSLYKKIVNKDDTVSWTEKSNREQRIQAYKNIITEYNSCQ